MQRHFRTGSEVWNLIKFTYFYIIEKVDQNSQLLPALTSSWCRLTFFDCQARTDFFMILIWTWRIAIENMKNKIDWKGFFRWRDEGGLVVMQKDNWGEAGWDKVVRKIEDWVFFWWFYKIERCWTVFPVKCYTYFWLDAGQMSEFWTGHIFGQIL